MAEGKLHIGRDVWTWTMPSSSYVLIRDPKRKKTAVKPFFIEQEWRKERDVKDLRDPEHDWNTEHCFFNVTPAKVKAYITRVLLQP
jgi:hypothetical protein